MKNVRNKRRLAYVKISMTRGAPLSQNPGARMQNVDKMGITFV